MEVIATAISNLWKYSLRTESLELSVATSIHSVNQYNPDFLVATLGFPTDVLLPEQPDESLQPEDLPIGALYEDDALIAVDKPSGTAVHGGSGVSFGVIEQLRAQRPELRFLELVHRLDRDTSGVLLLAKKRKALVALHEALREVLLRVSLIGQHVPEIVELDLNPVIALPDGHAFGPGRFDQYLYPHYRRSIDAGDISQDQAQELLDDLLGALVSAPAQLSDAAIGFLPIAWRCHSADPAQW